jgi:hypothetical protein
VTALFPNDDDWIIVAPDIQPYETLTAAASNGALPVEILCGTSEADAAVVSSGTGTATASGLSTGARCWVRVLPDPGAAGCAAEYDLTLTLTLPP